MISFHNTRKLYSLKLIVLLMVYPFSYAYFDIQIKTALQDKISKPVPQWVQDQITSDFHDSTLITSCKIEKTFLQYTGSMLRCTIQKGECAFYCNRNKGNIYAIAYFVALLIKELHSYVTLPDSDFLIGLDDTVSSDQCLVPILGFCKKIGEKNIILIPDYQVFHLLQKSNYLSFVDCNIVDKIRESNELYPWDKKISQAIWRGADTGHHYDLNNYHELPRIKLANLSIKFAALLNAKLTYLNNNDCVLGAKLKELNYLDSNLSIQDHIKYKYQILIDGNTASWPGAYWRFHSNSLVFKQDSPYIQWYYSLLKPYIHYIPFSSNLDNVIERIDWAMKNDLLAQQMVVNANTMSAQNITYTDMLYYFYEVLLHYAHFQKNFK